MRTIAEIHIIQTLPPSNANRDDMGAPKSAVYGGILRHRVSSQAWKRITREALFRYFDETDMSLRTKETDLANLVARRIREATGADEPEEGEDDAQKTAVAVLQAAGLKVTKDAPKAKAKKAAEVDETETESDDSKSLVFVSRRQVDALTDIALGVDGPLTKDQKAAAKAAFKSPAVDLALFGRMVASAKDANVDASCYVADALSVHATQVEQDYFTAVNELGDNSGAGIIGVQEFTSSTLYRHAVVDVDLLHRNLGEGIDDGRLAAKVTAAFVKAFTLSVPSGKRSTYQHVTRPEAVIVKLRDSYPANLITAFETPVSGQQGGHVGEAAERLAAEMKEVDSMYDGEGSAHSLARSRADILKCGQVADSLDALADNLEADILQRFGSGK